MNQVCKNLSSGMLDQEQAAVQAVAAMEQTISLIMQNIPMVIFTLFLGPWSDTAGRKLLICLPLFGHFLFHACMILNVYFFDQLVVEFLWLEAIRSFFGGWILFFVGSYGYIADTTTDSSRTLRITIFDGIFAVSNTIGSFLNGYIFKAFGYYGVFGIGGLANFVGAVILFTGIHETPKVKEEDRNLFDLQNIFSCAKVLVKPRPQNLRPVLILLFSSFQLFMVAVVGVRCSASTIVSSYSLV